MKFTNIISSTETAEKNLYVMKLLKPFYQQRLVLNLVHVVPKDDIFILQNVGINFLLLYVYDNVHIVGFSKNILVRNTRSKQHKLKNAQRTKNMESDPETDHSYSLIIHYRSPTLDKYERYFTMASRNLVCVIQLK